MNLLFRKSGVATVAALMCGLFATSLYAENAGKTASPATGIWATDNLVAWCVVPFDATRRNSESMERCSIGSELRALPTIGALRISRPSIKRSRP